MPKRSDIHTILVIGAGPIVIGQACEFDYSGTQACKTLQEDGYRVVLVNSNPATIMTDPSVASRTYIEPIHPDIVEKIIVEEKIDAILPTVGGQTALNCVLKLHQRGSLEKLGVELIGANIDAIEVAENRQLFAEAMEDIGLKTTQSTIANTMEEARLAVEKIGYPAIIRPSFTLGGEGGGIAYNAEEFVTICQSGFEASPNHQLLIDQSVIGWKEYELEVVRDRQDNAIIVCSIENVDPMGVHTGDSITVAPALTLSDKEMQTMRDAAIAVLRKVGVDTGGSNVQFAVNPENGDQVVIEMNPRVSRSSALASKATGFPIAKVAARLAVGYTLDELKNEIIGLPASFEPTLDYVVVKIPRFNFEKFSNSDEVLTTSMKSVGEAMAFGRNFQEALQKAFVSLEVDLQGLEPITDLDSPDAKYLIKQRLSKPVWNRLLAICDAFRFNMPLEEIHFLTKIDRWFLHQLQSIVTMEKQLVQTDLADVDKDAMLQAKRAGFSDGFLAQIFKVNEQDVTQHRHRLEVHPVYKRVDSVAGEFLASTTILYSTYDANCEARPTNRKKIVVLGGGANRIGQGIEFDYCCVHAALTSKASGYESIMINSNPETVSTDYDTSDRLYFEPLSYESIMEIMRIEMPTGVIVHFGGQTPLKLTKRLEQAQVPIIGTSADAIDRAEDRQRFSQLINKLGLKQPEHISASSPSEAMRAAQSLSFPIMIRPSYVLGGRSMEVLDNTDELQSYLDTQNLLPFHYPLLLDRFLQQAIELDVDVVCDGENAVIGGVLEHIEEAGIHSGDSSCCLPAHSISATVRDKIIAISKSIALELKVVGLVNIQFAIEKDEIYIIEVNPRASRTVPFISKATSRNLAQIATRCKLGISLEEQGVTSELLPPYYAVKHSIFSSERFIDSDPILGPEMRSTGEVMGLGKTFAHAFARAHIASGKLLPAKGQILLSVKRQDKQAIIPIVKKLHQHGFTFIATRGTQHALLEAGIPCEITQKVLEGRPHIVDLIKSGKVDFIINTTRGRQAIIDSHLIRKTALCYKIPMSTTLKGAEATCLAMLADDHFRDIYCIQDFNS